MDIQKQKLSRRSFLKVAGAGVALGLGGSLASQCVVPATLEPEAKPTTVPLKNKAVDLTFWTIPYWKGRTGKEEGGKETDYYTWKIEEFNQEYPNVSIKVEFVPSSFEGFAKFDTAVASGNPPDVMWGQSGNHWKYAPQDAIEPFDDWMDPEAISDLLEPAKDICSYVDGKIYLWPYGMALAGGMFVNSEIFEKFGASDLLPSGKERGWTTTEFEKALEATTGEIDGQEIYGMALMTDWYYQPMQFFYGFGANLYNPYQTKMLINSPEGVECMQWLVDLEHKQGWMLPGTAGRTNDNVLRLFQEQKIAVYPSQPYYITAFRLQPELKPSCEWVFCQPPHKEDKEIGAEANIHGYLLARQEDKDKLAIAVEFVKHLTKPENLEIAAWGQGVVPPRKSMMNILEGDEDRYVEGILAAHAVPFSRLYGEIAPKAITPGLDAAFAQTKTPQEALDGMAEAGNKILKETAEQYGWPMD
jgi:ABC-type glycerol-3-phosphate transport system substrate-binding protein